MTATTFSSATSDDNRDGQTRSVAIVAWQSLGAVFPDRATAVGGMETAAWRFATGLAQQTAWRPTLVFRSPAHVNQREREGVRLHVDVDPWESIRRSVSAAADAKARGVRWFHPRLLWQVPLLAASWPIRRRDPALMQTDPRLQSVIPDAWIAMGVGRESAGVIATAAAQGKPSLLMLRSGADLDERYTQSELSLSDYGERSDVCRFAIDQATAIACQTEVQQQRLREVFGRDGALIRNAIDLSPWRKARADGPARDHVLWVGRYETFAKRIDKAIEIARRCADVPFRMIVNPDDQAVESEVRAALPANVEIVDYVPFDEMPREYCRATVFLSTSSSRHEGFPNVLLQAAACGTPIVSLDDFDGFLDRSGAGEVCDGDLEQAAQAIKRLHSDGDKSFNPDVDAYLDQHHATGRIAIRLGDVLDDLTRATGDS